MNLRASVRALRPAALTRAVIALSCDSGGLAPESSLGAPLHVIDVLDRGG